jgi:hypothetical protein
MSSTADSLHRSSQEFLNSVPHRVGDRKLWSLNWISGILRHGLTGFDTYRQVRQLLKLPPFVDTVENNPKFAFKYLAVHYLARGLTITERAGCFLHHYQRLHRLLPDRVLRQVLHWDLELYEFDAGDNHFCLTMGRARPFYKEGEMSLNFKIDGQIFFTLSFTIVPGWVIHAHTPEVLLISRLQGTPGCYPDQMKTATKAMQGVRPRTALLFALQGIAEALGISEVASVSARRHGCHTAACEPLLRKAYDEFFEDLNFAPNSAGFFLIPVPLQETPLESISPGNRSRAKNNRAFKERLRRTCAEVVDKIGPRT